MTGFNAIGFFAVCKNLAKLFAGSADCVAVTDCCLLISDYVSCAVITVIKGDCNLITACRTYGRVNIVPNITAIASKSAVILVSFLFLIKFVILKFLS